MANEDKSAPAALRTAAELRQELLNQQMKKMDESEAAEAEQQRERDALAERFMHEEITDAERATIRRLIDLAVAEGHTQAMVYSFPSALCTDHGRAINNGEHSWPETLQGKAKELYERYEKMGRPAGYKLRAMIINFPNDMPGDVGLFLSWGEY